MKTGLCGLYRFKDNNNQIIYIGKADDIHKRLWTHKHLSNEAYNSIATIEYCVVKNRANRDILELILISKNHPKYNIQLQYEEETTLLIGEEIELIWNKEPDKDKYINKILSNIQNITNNKIKNNHPGTVGRPKIPIPENFSTLYPLWKEGKITAVEFAKETNLTKATFYNRIKEYESNLKLNN